MNGNRNDSQTELLLRFLEGTLPEEEEKALRGQLTQSQMLRDQLAELQRLRTTLRSNVERSAERSLKPLFSDRVIGRLMNAGVARFSAEDEELRFLTRLFRPVVIVGALFATALAIYNVDLSSSYETQGSVAESVLAMPAVSTSTVYDLDFSTNYSDTEQQ